MSVGVGFGALISVHLLSYNQHRHKVLDEFEIRPTWTLRSHNPLSADKMSGA